MVIRWLIVGYSLLTPYYQTFPSISRKQVYCVAYNDVNWAWGFFLICAMA